MLSSPYGRSFHLWYHQWCHGMFLSSLSSIHLIFGISFPRSAIFGGVPSPSWAIGSSG